MRWKLFSPILLLACLTFTGCRKIQDPEFKRIDHLGIKNWSFQNATVGFSVTYFNPNNFGVSVKEAEADVYLDSSYLGKFTQDSTVDVKGNSEFSIPFSGTISLQTALNMNLDSLARKDVLLKADGFVKVGKAGIYITRPIHYEGLHRLDEIRLQ
jgi:LEA14-like dessication related protein